MSSSHTCGPDLGPARLHEVADRIYAYVQPDGSWWINNAGFLVGKKGIVSVDTCATERRTKAYLEAVGQTSRLPVRTLINTHHHGDHTYGNYLLPQATIIAHEKTREQMLAYGLPNFPGVFSQLDFGAIQVEPPFVTYQDGVTLWVDELRCEVRYVGSPAHTTNDSVVWIPEHRLLFSGDLIFNGGTPFLVMGSIAGAVQVLEHLKTLGARTIVPGHGQVCGPELFDIELGYLRFVQDLARRSRDAGVSPLEAVRSADLGEYREWLDPERTVGNLHRALAELDGQPLGAPIDIAGALKDMIAYNGGKPLTCLA